MKRIASLLVALCAFTVSAKDAPKNIIMVIGDGMGPAYLSAYRFYMDDKSGDLVNRTVFDRNLVGMSSTNPARVSGYVTDSAAGATALATGYKSYNGSIGVDVDKKPLLTLLEYAKQKGMKTGVAVTSQINHATPASFASHNESRQNYNEIADSYFDTRINNQFVLDVMLGGGTKYFIRDDRDLVSEFKGAGYQYVDSVDALGSLDTNKPVLGLFAEVGLPWALDSNGHGRLTAMTKSAIAHLENDKGFFLVIEASQVDWAGHSNDIASAMAEMHGLAKTLEWLEQYVGQRDDTLVVVTADHSTGGMSIAANGKYTWNPEWIKGLKASPQKMAEQAVNQKEAPEIVERLIGFELTEDEKSAIVASNEDMKVLYSAIKSILDARSNTGWTTSGHTAIDVPVLAFGKGKQQFAGHLDNVEIPAIMFRILGKH